MTEPTKTIFLILDHGLGLGCFFETELAQYLLECDLQVVVFVQESMLDYVRTAYQKPNLIFESMRDGEIQRYRNSRHAGMYELVEHVRRASANHVIPLTYVDTHRKRKEFESTGRRRWTIKLMRPFIYLNRYSRIARWLFRKLLAVMDTPSLYRDLFEIYQPVLVVSQTAGWRLDQYMLREASRLKIKTAYVTVGWDNPSSQGLPGAFIDQANVWSEIHRWELSKGSDWNESDIHVGGMPLFDGYISHQWLIDRHEYFRMHGLDPNKKLIAFAATALSITPNLHIIEALVKSVHAGRINQPAQVLIRFHPNHFKEQGHYREEYQAIKELVAKYPDDIKFVEPKETPGGIERYSGEDFPEKASMMYYCDVMVTIYSTMVVEAALVNTPFISACIPIEGGWGKGKFSIDLREVPAWPTASRVNEMKAGKTVFTTDELVSAINQYLDNPTLDQEQRRAFVRSELTYLDGEATRKTAQFILGLLKP
ncbi:MAG: hypothetical protein HPY85_02270 [Anaerolineae bacterium]|nr:hypothetical protein [Anaerolineae bacterium]